MPASAEPGAGPAPDRYALPRVAALFDGLAPGYGRWQAWLSGGLGWVWRRWAVGQLHLPAGARVVDLMCGTGELWPHLRRALGPAGHLIGLDASGAMLARAAHRAGGWPGPGQVTLLRADARAVPLPAGQADAVACAFGLKTLAPADWPALVAEARRLVRPGGRFVLVDLWPPPGSPTAWLVSAWLRTAARLTGRAGADALLAYVEADAAARRAALAQLAATGVLIHRLPGGGLGLTGTGE